MADRTDDVIEEVSSSQGRQVHEVGESSKPPQPNNDIFETQLVATVTMFSQMMQNPRFLAFLQPPLPTQQIGSQVQIPEPVGAQAQVMHNANSVETPMRLADSMETPNPIPIVREQVAEMPASQDCRFSPPPYSSQMLAQMDREAVLTGS
ncbi:hypothetical protein L7F22_025757 [Adiantum nelumboides]|nr:hypothetical protein [Adiantum nelumboides]